MSEASIDSGGAATPITRRKLLRYGAALTGTGFACTSDKNGDAENPALRFLQFYAPGGEVAAQAQLVRECAILSWKLKRLPTPWFDDVGKNNIKPQEKGAEMGSLLRTAKKHKKSRRLGKPEVMAREEYGELEVDVKIEMIRSLISLGLMHVHELLDDEVKELAGERYARKDELECCFLH